ncbi:MAG TPA: tetratricopeptide repeat protein [Pyrinomonadaceae bacterium]|jgi:CHAT domain-containing protein/Tfp pilus assembly protein PilF
MSASSLSWNARTWRRVAVLLITLLASQTAVGQSAQADVRELRFGKTFERKIRTGELHQYEFALRRGQVLFVELDEGSFDSKVELFEAAGRKSVAVMNLGNGFERETLTFEAGEGGEYLLQVGDAEGQSVSGGYRLKAKVADAASERDRARVEAERLSSEAAASQKENTADKIREAIAKHGRALTLWRNVGDRYWESYALNRLGGAHNLLSENNRAIEYLDLSMRIVGELGDRKIEAASLNCYGSVLNGFGEYERAAGYHQRAHKLFRAEKINIGAANSLMLLGHTRMGLKDYPKANEYYQAGLTIARQEQNKNWEASFVYLLGTVLETQQEKAKALDSYGRALALLRETKHDGGVALALLGLGRLHTPEGRTEKALECLDEALRLFEAEKNRKQATAARNLLFSVYSRTGKRKEGVELLKQSLAFYREFKIRVLEISMAGLIASVQSSIGENKEAIEYAELTLATEESVPERIVEASKKGMEGGMKESKAMALRTLGSIYFNMGDTEKALDYHSRSLAFFEKYAAEDTQLQVVLSLEAIAQVYQLRYDWAKVRETYDRLMPIAKGLEDKTFLVMALNTVGIVYGTTGESGKALRYYEEALTTLRALPKHEDVEKRFEANLLGNIGGSHASLGRPEKALQYYEEALAVAQSISDPRFVDLQAIAYQRIADHLATRGQNAKALELLDKALKLFRQTPAHVKALARNRTTEAQILGRIGYVHKEMGKLREAADIYESVLKTAVEMKDLELESSALNNIARIDFTAGEPQKAFQNFTRALELARKLEDKSSEAILLNNIALVYSHWGDRQGALDHVRRALAITEELGNKSHVATFLGNIGMAHKDLSENETALDYFNRALALARELGKRSTEATTLNNLASLSSNIGERGRAIGLYEQALEIARSTGEKNLEATILGNMAFEYLELGENRKALELRQEELKISRETGDRMGEITGLLGVGNIYRKMGEAEKSPERFRQSLASYEQALGLSREAESKSGEALSLYGIGQVYIETGEAAKALPPLNRALDYARKHQDRLLEDLVHVALGRLHEKAGRPDEAVAEYRRALTVARAISDRDTEAKALRGLMSSWKRRGEERSAIFYGKQAVNAYQQLRGSIRNLRRETQDAFRDKVTDVYRELSGLLIEHERFAEAEQVLGMLKEAEFKQLQVRRGPEDLDTIPYSTTEDALLAKVESLVALERERAELLRLPAGSRSEGQERRLDELREAANETNAKLDAELKKLGEAEPSAAKRAGEINSEALIQRALTQLEQTTKSRVVALYTVLGTEKEQDGTGNLKTRFGWVVMFTEKGSKAYPIDVTNLNRLIFSFRAALTSDARDPRPLAEQIYAAIFRQTSPKQSRTLEADLRDYMGAGGAKTLMWSLDGVLRYVPMAALHDGERYLVERYGTVVLSRHSSRSLTEGNRPDWQVLGLGLSEARENFHALPGVKTELETIVRQPDSQTGIIRGTIKLNEDFKKRLFLSAVGGGTFPVVHVASHYSFNPARQADSFLLIGDGRLTFSEMKEDRNLFGAVDLLTLSACDTAMSANGEESEGFAFLAQELGAKAVLASLWKVSDAGTPELMTRFYRQRADDTSLPKGEAFRRAQLSLLHGNAGPEPPPSAAKRGVRLVAGHPNGDSGLPPFARDPSRPYAHPHYWASFVLIGNWK